MSISILVFGEYLVVRSMSIICCMDRFNINRSEVVNLISKTLIVDISCKGVFSLQNKNFNKLFDKLKYFVFR